MPNIEDLVREDRALEYPRLLEENSRLKDELLKLRFDSGIAQTLSLFHQKRAEGRTANAETQIAALQLLAKKNRSAWPKKIKEVTQDDIPAPVRDQLDTTAVMEALAGLQTTGFITKVPSRETVLRKMRKRGVGGDGWKLFRSQDEFNEFVMWCCKKLQPRSRLKS